MVSLPASDGTSLECIFKTLPEGHTNYLRNFYVTRNRHGWPFAAFETINFDGAQVPSKQRPLPAPSVIASELSRVSRDDRDVYSRSYGPLITTEFINWTKWECNENPNFGPLWVRASAWKIGKDFQRIYWLGLLANFIILFILLFGLRMIRKRIASARRHALDWRLTDLLVFTTLICCLFAWYANARHQQSKIPVAQLHSDDLEIHAPNWLLRLVGQRRLRAFLRPLSADRRTELGIDLPLGE